MNLSESSRDGAISGMVSGEKALAGSDRDSELNSNDVSSEGKELSSTGSICEAGDQDKQGLSSERNSVETEEPQQILRTITPKKDFAGSVGSQELTSKIQQNFLTEENITSMHSQGASGIKMTVQKPFNSPMLIASVASVSASSPASGDIIVDQNQQYTNQLPGSIDSNSQIVNGDEPKRRQGTSGDQNDSEQQLFQNYEHTSKQLRFENVSSQSLVLNHSSGTSNKNSQKPSVVSKDPKPQMWSCISEQRYRQSKSSHGVPRFVVSSRDGSQTSGCGSILQNFITEDVASESNLDGNNCIEDVNNDDDLIVVSDIKIDQLEATVKSDEGEKTCEENKRIRDGESKEDYADVAEQLKNQQQFLEADLENQEQEEKKEASAKAMTETHIKGSCSDNLSSSGLNFSNPDDVGQREGEDCFSDLKSTGMPLLTLSVSRNDDSICPIESMANAKYNSPSQVRTSDVRDDGSSMKKAIEDSLNNNARTTERPRDIAGAILPTSPRQGFTLQSPTQTQSITYTLCSEDFAMSGSNMPNVKENLQAFISQHQELREDYGFPRNRDNNQHQILQHNSQQREYQTSLFHDQVMAANRHIQNEQEHRGGIGNPLMLQMLRNATENNPYANHQAFGVPYSQIYTGAPQSSVPASQFYQQQRQEEEFDLEQLQDEDEEEKGAGDTIDEQSELHLNNLAVSTGQPSSNLNNLRFNQHSYMMDSRDASATSEFNPMQVNSCTLDNKGEPQSNNEHALDPSKSPPNLIMTSNQDRKQLADIERKPVPTIQIDLNSESFYKQQLAQQHQKPYRQDWPNDRAVHPYYQRADQDFLHQEQLMQALSAQQVQHEYHRVEPQVALYGTQSEILASEPQATNLTESIMSGTAQYQPNANPDPGVAVQNPDSLDIRHLYEAVKQRNLQMAQQELLQNKFRAMDLQQSSPAQNIYYKQTSYHCGPNPQSTLQSIAEKSLNPVKEYDEADLEMDSPSNEETICMDYKILQRNRTKQSNIQFAKKPQKQATKITMKSYQPQKLDFQEEAQKTTKFQLTQPDQVMQKLRSYTNSKKKKGLNDSTPSAVDSQTKTTKTSRNSRLSINNRQTNDYQSSTQRGSKKDKNFLSPISAQRHSNLPVQTQVSHESNKERFSVKSPMSKGSSGKLKLRQLLRTNDEDPSQSTYYAKGSRNRQGTQLKASKAKKSVDHSKRHMQSQKDISKNQTASLSASVVGAMETEPADTITADIVLSKKQDFSFKQMVKTARSDINSNSSNPKQSIQELTSSRRPKETKLTKNMSQKQFSRNGSPKVGMKHKTTGPLQIQIEKPESKFQSLLQSAAEGIQSIANLRGLSKPADQRNNSSSATQAQPMHNSQTRNNRLQNNCMKTAQSGLKTSQTQSTLLGRQLNGAVTQHNLNQTIHNTQRTLEKHNADNSRNLPSIKQSCSSFDLVKAVDASSRVLSDGEKDEPKTSVPFKSNMILQTQSIQSHTMQTFEDAKGDIHGVGGVCNDSNLLSSVKQRDSNLRQGEVSKRTDSSGGGERLPQRLLLRKSLDFSVEQQSSLNQEQLKELFEGVADEREVVVSSDSKPPSYLQRSPQGDQNSHYHQRRIEYSQYDADMIGIPHQSPGGGRYPELNDSGTKQQDMLALAQSQNVLGKQQSPMHVGQPPQQQQQVSMEQFQNALKMTEYLMKEIERLQQSQPQTREQTPTSKALHHNRSMMSEHSQPSRMTTPMYSQHQPQMILQAHGLQPNYVSDQMHPHNQLEYLQSISQQQVMYGPQGHKQWISPTNQQMHRQQIGQINGQQQQQMYQQMANPSVRNLSKQFDESAEAHRRFNSNNN